MTKTIKTVPVHRSDYVNHLKKAAEFHEVMLEGLSKGKWNAVGLNAIHAGISAADALLVFSHGIRSASPKHDDVIKLLTSLISHKEIKEKSSHLRNLIYMKNIVEYEVRLIDKGEALSLSKHASRFLEWVRSILPLSATYGDSTL